MDFETESIVGSARITSSVSIGHNISNTEVFVDGLCSSVVTQSIKIAGAVSGKGKVSSEFRKGKSIPDLDFGDTKNCNGSGRCDHGSVISMVLKGPSTISLTPSLAQGFRLVRKIFENNFNLLTSSQYVIANNLQAGDFVSLQGQNNPSENGIYQVVSGGFVFNVSNDSVVIDPGVIANDSLIGDVSRSVVVDYSYVNLDVTGIFYIYYMVLNSLNVSTIIKRRVKITKLNSSIAPVGILKLTQYDITSGFDKRLLKNHNLS